MPQKHFLSKSFNSIRKEEVYWQVYLLVNHYFNVVNNSV